ncbi:hypothetical protein Tco_0609480 [Tanacetum coccineum]
MYKVHTKPNQTRTPQLHQDIRKPNKRVSFSTGVIPNTRVSRPQLKSNHLEDRVMSNNSQGKKQEVEDHRRKFKQPMVVPISTREPKQNVNQSVATSSKKTVATDSTVKKFRNTTRKIYEQLVEIILFIVDSGCSKHMTRNLKLLTNFVEKFLGTVKFGNDQIAPILGYGDLVQGTITIKRVYYVEGLNHNLFSVGQFYGKILDKMKEKGDACILLGILRSLKAYMVFDKRTRIIVETIHVNFDELPQMASDHVSSDPSPQCSTMSSVVHAADNPDKRQQHNTTHTSTTTDVADPPPLDIQSTHQTLTQVSTVTASENIIQAETNTENA